MKARISKENTEEYDIINKTIDNFFRRLSGKKTDRKIDVLLLHHSMTKVKRKPI